MTSVHRAFLDAIAAEFPGVSIMGSSEPMGEGYAHFAELGHSMDTVTVHHIPGALGAWRVGTEVRDTLKEARAAYAARLRARLALVAP